MAGKNLPAHTVTKAELITAANVDNTLGGCIKNSTYPDVIGVFTGVKFGATVVWGICGQGSGCPRGCGVHVRDFAEVNRCGAVVQTSEGIEPQSSNILY